MLKVIGVRFKEAGKIYYFDPGEWRIERNDAVIVETVRGIEYGNVVLGIRHVREDEVVLPLKKVLRVATEEDVKTVEDNRRAAREALGICEEKIRAHGLEMKLVDAEYTFDRNKIIFYFTADGRVDFRELVRDLASVFRTRIELRQIGVRDEAKMLGGIGPCGRILCCSSFLGDFEPVSIKMAKDQNLSLNPAKISGLCGRLMCCLKFENDVYEESKRLLPDVGERVLTTRGEGRVVLLNLLERKLQVELNGSRTLVECTLEEIQTDSSRDHSRQASGTFQ
ncbi:PSP1 domain-containing protein [Staphylospora marina]|uniref:PSP1 domain-containing protein n=1 Tax=Staphylospora marina TaxID=2490858 RepID=UPI000F5C01C0|nr:stage 0 sporulation family protein [Staphylospora marina]